MDEKTVRDVTAVLLLEADWLHAGYPMIDNMLALLQANSHVYVDGTGLIWSYPLKEVNRCISGWWKLDLKIVMFRTDQAATAQVDGVCNRDHTNGHLTPGQMRDILYNNVVRFLRRASKSPKVI